MVKCSIIMHGLTVSILKALYLGNGKRYLKSDCTIELLDPENSGFGTLLDTLSTIVTTLHAKTTFPLKKL